MKKLLIAAMLAFTALLPCRGGYIDEQTALANVKQLAGSGAQIISWKKGLSPGGLKAWVVVVAPVTTKYGPETVTYYSGFGFCFYEPKFF